MTPQTPHTAPLDTDIGNQFTEKFGKWILTNPNNKMEEWINKMVAESNQRSVKKERECILIELRRVEPVLRRKIEEKSSEDLSGRLIALQQIISFISGKRKSLFTTSQEK